MISSCQPGHTAFLQHVSAPPQHAAHSLGFLSLRPPWFTFISSPPPNTLFHLCDSVRALSSQQQNKWRFSGIVGLKCGIAWLQERFARVCFLQRLCLPLELPLRKFYSYIAYRCMFICNEEAILLQLGIQHISHYKSICSIKACIVWLQCIMVYWSPCQQSH